MIHATDSSTLLKKHFLPLSHQGTKEHEARSPRADLTWCGFVSLSLCGGTGLSRIRPGDALLACARHLAEELRQRGLDSQKPLIHCELPAVIHLMSRKASPKVGQLSQTPKRSSTKAHYPSSTILSLTYY